MNQKQTRYFRRNLSVQSAFDNHSSVWSGNPKFVSTKNQFDTLLAEAASLDETASGNTVGNTRSKNQVKAALVQKVLIFSGTLYAHASVTKDEVLKSVLETSQSTIDNMAETKLNTYSKVVHSKAEAIVDTLTTEYGITAEELTDLETTIAEFEQLIGKAKQQQSSINALKRDLEEVINEANDLLNDVLDNLMLRYRYTDATFYNEYEQSKTIIG